MGGMKQDVVPEDGARASQKRQELRRCCGGGRDGLDAQGSRGAANMAAARRGEREMEGRKEREGEGQTDLANYAAF